MLQCRASPYLVLAIVDKEAKNNEEESAGHSNDGSHTFSNTCAGSNDLFCRQGAEGRKKKKKKGE